MTVVSDGTAVGQAAVPAGPEPPEDDVVVLAGDQLLPEGVWLLVTRVEAVPGGVFTGVRLPAQELRAFGGDVVVRLAADPGRLPSSPDGHVQMYAVMAGTLVLVAEWGIANSSDWSEVVRVTAAFAMGMLTELEEHGADLAPGQSVDLGTAAAIATAGVPAGVTFGTTQPGAPAGP